MWSLEKKSTFISGNNKKKKSNWKIQIKQFWKQSCVAMYLLCFLFLPSFLLFWFYSSLSEYSLSVREQASIAWKD